MSADPFASVTVTKPGRARTQMARPRQEEDDPFAAVQVRPSAPPAKARQTTPLAPMQVTAEAPRNPLEMALARTQLAQRGQLQGQFVEQKPKPPVREMDVPLAIGRGLAEPVFATAQGVANILDRLPLIESAGEAVRKKREEARQFYGEPESDVARYAMLGAQMLGTGAQFALPGAAAGRAAQAAQAGSRVQRALQLAAAPLGEGGAVRTAAGRVLGGTVMASPINLAVSQSPEDAAAPAIAQATAGAESPVLRAIGKVAERASQSPAGRFAFETGLDVLAGGAGETLLAGARGARRLAGTAMPEAPMPAIPSKPTQETIDRAAFTSKLNRALEAGNDAEVTRLLERQQQLRPLDEQLEDALDRQANARGKKAKQRADAEVERVLTLMDQQALPVQGPQQWRGPQRFAADPDQMTVREELVDVGQKAFERLKQMQPGLSTQEVTPDFISSLYSRVERQIEKAPFAKGTGQQWAAQLAKNTAKGEREFTGIDTFLQENAGKVLTRDEVQQAFDASRVQLAETQYGQRGFLTMEERLREPNMGRRKEPRWEQYAVPGERQNYREVMIQKPGDEVFRYRTHWDEPNVMTHVRMSDRTIDGKKTLFVEELQDDWAQQARKPIGPKDPETGKQPTRGYRTPEQDAEYAALQAANKQNVKTVRSMTARRRELEDELNAMSSTMRVVADPAVRQQMEERATQYLDEMVALDTPLREARNEGALITARLYGIDASKTLPNRPFKQTSEWTELGIKRAIDEAVRGGYDQVALITGKQAADVYDLRKQVDRLEWRATMDADAGTLVGYKNGAQVLNQSMAADALDDYVGGELAGQLRFRAGEDDNLVGRVAGKDFEVGGKGMQKFYDEMLPNVIKDYSKKLGVPLTVRRVGTADAEAARAQLKQLEFARTQTNVREEVDAINDQILEARANYNRAEKGLAGAGNLIIDITPQVREKILTEGQPLWAMGGDAGLALGGGLAGGTQGETTEERLSNAALLAGTLGGARVLRNLRARPNNPAAVDRLLSLMDDPITYFRELGDDPARLTRSLAEFRATTPVVRRLAQEAGDAPEQVDDVLTAARNLVEGRIDALARRTGPLAQMMEEIKGVKETTVEDAAKLAEQNTAQRLKEMRKRGPIDLSNATPAQRATRAMQLGMEDMREAIRRFGRDASEWYSKQGRQASAQMQAIIPELRGNPEKRFIADVILAITSSGATVEDNLSRAIPIIRQWLNTGEITQLDAAKGITPASEETLAPTGQLLKSGEPQMARIRSGIFREDLKGSTRAQAIETGLRKLQLFLDANGGDERAVRNFLLSEYKTKGTAARPSRTAPMSAEVMGPKIGRFLLNVQGMGDEVTVDSWATRTWMRWMGYGENARLEFDPEAKGMVLRGGPTPGEQPEIRNAFTKLAQSISKETGQDFTPADVQALLWYLEKFNYGKWGSTSDLVSFADVGDRFLMEGVPQPQQSNVAGTPYQFKFGTGETSGLDNATLRQYLGQFGREGKVYDIGGALGEGVTALARTPEGRRLLGNVALGTTGYALTGDDDELLRNTGKGMMALALGSAIYPALKVGVRQGAKGLAEQLQQTPRGRYALNLLSRDITTDPAVRKAVEDALAERSQITARFQELSRRARELGPQADRVISDLLEGEAFAAREMAQMSPDDVATATALAQRIASQVRELGSRKVEEDLISEQTFLKRAETYLPRLYARYDAEGLVDEVTATHRGKTFRITGEKIRNDALTPEERDALGEIREASYRLAEAGKRGAQDISTARLFRTLADMPGVIHPEFKAAKENELMAQLFAKQALKTGDRSAAREALRAAREARAEAKQLAETFTQPNYATQWLKQAAEGKGYVRLPDTPNMGQLRGAVVRADVADYLHDLPDLASAPGTYRDLLRTWKTIKTIYNVGTQVTNVLSNFAVVHAAGIPWWKQAARFRGAARDLTSYGPATKALTEAGVMGVNMPGFGDVPVKNVAADVSALRQLAETTRPETRQALAQEGIMPYGKLAKLGVKGRTKAQQYYAAGDGVFRVMLYQKYVKDGLTSDEAIQEVMRNMPSYDTRSPILGALRMGPAPFIMYPAKYLPTALDNIMMHPYRWATLAGTTWALMDQASRRLYGKIEEEDLPPNRRRSETFGYLLPGVTQIDALMRPALKAMGRTPDEERKYTIDAARFTPLSALTGSPVPGADLSSQLLGDRAPQILQPSGPLMDIAALALGKNAYTGEDFFSPSDEPLDKALKLGGWASRMALPTFLGVHTPRVIGDIRRGDIDAAMTNALGILGMRPTMVTPGMQTQIQQRRFEEQMSDARIKLRQELRKAKTPEEEARIEQKYEAKMMRLAAKYQQRLDEEEE